MDTIKKTFIGLTALTIAMATSAMATSVRHAQTTPFTDNVTINLQGFPAEISHIYYQSDNDVDISGPESINTGTVKNYNFSISSHNISDNGYPSMDITLPKTKERCIFNFVDGPWVYLGYRASNPPICAHLSVSPITQDGPYHYSINVAYKN